VRTILINHKGHQVTTSIKTEWNELSWSDLKFVIEHFFGNLRRMYETIEQKGKAPIVNVKDGKLLRSVIAGITVKLWDIKPRLLKEISGEQLDKLIDEYLPIEFLFKDNSFTRCPVARVFWWGWLYGPGDDFKTIDFEEYCYGDAQYHKFRSSRKEEDLNLFAALLIRKPGISTNIIDIRETFNPQLVERRLKAIRRIPFEKKFALWLWWEGCRNKQAGIYKHFFKKSDASSSPSSGGSMFQLMMEMSKDIFGPLDKTKRVNCKVAFSRMDQLIKQSEDRERELERK
jgi:hypothetical protein